MPKTLFEKLWAIHEVADFGDGDSLMHIDRIFLHERTGSIALKGLQDKQIAISAPQHVFCTMDHIVDTTPGRNDDTLMPSGRDFIRATRKSAQQANITLFDLDSDQQGIVHVISPELGLALPGSSVVCPDSHTCTLGGIGALAWGIGSSEAEHAMATNTLRIKKPKTMRVIFSGELGAGVCAKDMILHLIACYGTAGGSGFAVEFAGDAVWGLSVESRLTLCNMAVEFSAFTGVIAVDQKTIEYCSERPYGPDKKLWASAANHWKSLYSDDNASFDSQITIDCTDLKPTVTWGTSPQHAVSIDDKIPDPRAYENSETIQSMTNALHYMDLSAGTPIRSIKIDAAFIGSCTNSRLSDLRSAAQYLKGKRVCSWVSAICVPGSTQVKREAEEEGLDKIFIEAGFSWRESGCSMCFYAGGETFGQGKRVISSTNRNFEGRQGPSTRTHLASPLTVAASACTGYICPAEL
jgi:3-isopropylmalate/(R)-2-methylmalate dehydratase large subunit